MHGLANTTAAQYVLFQMFAREPLPLTMRNQKYTGVVMCSQATSSYVAILLTRWGSPRNVDSSLDIRKEEIKN